MWKADPSTGTLVALDQPQAPLGFVPREAGPGGRAVWEYAVAPAHFNPNGVLHGGVVAALFDTAMGHAVAELVVRQGRFNAVAHLGINYLAAVRGGTLRVEANVVKAGKRLAVVEARLHDERGALLATASATHALLP